MKKLKVGVIGVGEMGFAHAKHIAFHIPNAQLTAVAAVFRERLEEVLPQLDDPKGYLDYKQLLADPDVDAVVIASATALHKEQALAALAAGKDVFIEKPIGMDVAECREIEEAAAASGRHFFVGFMRRYDPSYQEAKRRIEAGEIGMPILYRGYSWDPVWVAEYLAKRAELNGCWFLDMGVHDYDLARWFLGCEAEKVFACGGAYAYPVFDKTNDIDNGYALIKFENKSAAFIYPGRTAVHGSHVEGEIIGTKGSIRIGDDPAINMLKHYTADGITKKVFTHYLERWNQAYINELQAFTDLCLGLTDEEGPSAHDGLMATMMGLTVQKAYVSGELERFEGK